jgi:hypothetical protein
MSKAFRAVIGLEVSTVVSRPVKRFRIVILITIQPSKKNQENTLPNTANIFRIHVDDHTPAGHHPAELDTNSDNPESIELRAVEVRPHFSPPGGLPEVPTIGLYSFDFNHDKPLENSRENRENTQ